MKRRILIAVTDRYLMDGVKQIFENQLRNISIDFAFDEQMAKEKISSYAYVFVVAHQHLPRDGKTPIQEGENRGLSLSKWIDANANRISTVLLTFPSDTKVIEAVNQLENCDAVFIGLDKWEDSLVRKARKELAGQPVEETKKLDVDIYIDLEKNRVEADLKGVNFACFIPREPLKIQGIEKIIKLSMNAAQEVDRDEPKEPEKWEICLRKVGEALMRQIFEMNPDFLINFSSLSGMLGGLQNIRIRFIVEKKLHAVALEAIFGPYEFRKKDYWMLHVPIYRSLPEIPAWGYPLFHEKDEDMRGCPINVLIIESPTEGPIQLGKSTIQLDKLDNVARECRFLKSYLQAIKTVGSVSIGEVKLISCKNKKAPMKELLQKAIEKENQRWHVVHYAGHSYFNHLTQEGYVFFPGPHETIEIIKMGQLSSWMRKVDTRFVYLSSCHSSDVDFVFAMASQYIPAILGFRWVIDDDMAYQFTKAFYRKLLGGKKQSLEYAFLKARKKIYGKVKLNPIWASPVLVIQLPLAR